MLTKFVDWLRVNRILKQTPQQFIEYTLEQCKISQMEELAKIENAQCLLAMEKKREQRLIKHLAELLPSVQLEQKGNHVFKFARRAG